MRSRARYVIVLLDVEDESAGSCANRATPTQTKRVASQRRRSTFSRRKIFAAAAVPLKGSEAGGGAAGGGSPDGGGGKTGKEVRVFHTGPARKRALDLTAPPRPSLPT